MPAPGSPPNRPIRSGELPHHDHGHVDGIEEEKVPVDTNPYGMDDNLHPHDIKHHRIVERERTGDGK